ncbi:MAG: hypothetical protein ABIT05_05305 [Chitinophagaceae bacterium]
MNMDNNKKIEEILNSLDGSRKATMPDFFYTRLKARMEKGSEPAVKPSWVLRPVFAFSALVVVLLVNAAVMLKGDTVNENSVAETDNIQSIAAEYRLNDNNAILFDVNQDNK